MKCVCCVCKTPCGEYRGGLKCSVKDCMVPVIVCAECRETVGGGQSKPSDWNCKSCGDMQFGRNTSCRNCKAVKDTSTTATKSGGEEPVLQCPLCEEGFSLREKEAPRLKRAEKRKAAHEGEKAGPSKRQKHLEREPSTRLFVGNLPLAIDTPAIQKALGGPV